VTKCQEPSKNVAFDQSWQPFEAKKGGNFIKFGCACCNVNQWKPFLANGERALFPGLYKDGGAAIASEWSRVSPHFRRRAVENRSSR